MNIALAIFGLTSLTAAVAYGWRWIYLRGLVLDRLDEEPVQRELRLVRPATGSRPLDRNWWWVPWVSALPLGLVLYFIVGVPGSFCVSLAVIVALMGSQLEEILAQRRSQKLENQLADAIDIMVGALGAGVGVTGALEAALQETSQPLQGQLADVLSRIRYGDNAPALFRSLSQRIPLETFLLFSSALAVHWEVGGSLAPTLATVGRTIRDRIELSRRISSNVAQSQISTVMILLLTYFIAAIVYFNGPAQMMEFLQTSIGSFLAAGSMLLQAVGIVWMSQISRMRY